MASKKMKMEAAYDPILGGIFPPKPANIEKFISQLERSTIPYHRSYIGDKRSALDAIGFCYFITMDYRFRPQSGNMVEKMYLAVYRYLGVPVNYLWELNDVCESHQELARRLRRKMIHKKVLPA